MSTRPYPSYKDSGVEWLGRIPAHWQIKRFRHVTKRVDVGIAEAATHAYADEGVPILRSTNVRPNKILADDILKIERWFAEKNRSKYLFKDDIVTVRTGNAGVSAVIPDELHKSQCFTMLISTVKRQQCAQFYCHLLNADVGQAVFRLEAWGTAQANISVPILREVPVVEPPFPEQKVIADFLDRETGKIDALVKKKERLIELLQEKRTALISCAVTPPSPLKLGWKIRKLKLITCMKGRLGWQGLRQGEYTEEGPYLVSSEQFAEDRVQWEACNHVSQERFQMAPEIILREEDVLLMKDGAAMGKLAYIDRLLGQACLNSHLLLIRPNRAYCMPKFIYYALKTPHFNTYMIQERTGTTFFGITQASMGEYQLSFPSIAEQQRIIETLDKQTAKLDALMEKVRKAIERLEEYRTALISAAVTGQLDVRHVSP